TLTSNQTHLTKLNQPPLSQRHSPRSLGFKRLDSCKNVSNRNNPGTPLTQQHQSPHLLKILTSYPESDRLADERCTVMSKNNGHESPLKRKTPQGESQKLNMAMAGHGSPTGVGQNCCDGSPTGVFQVNLDSKNKHVQGQAIGTVPEVWVSKRLDSYLDNTWEAANGLLQIWFPHRESNPGLGTDGIQYTHQLHVDEGRDNSNTIQPKKRPSSLLKLRIADLEENQHERMDKSNQAEANSATNPLTQQHQSPHLLKILTSYPESDRLADERCTVMSKNNGHESPLKEKTPQGESQKLNMAMAGHGSPTGVGQNCCDGSPTGVFQVNLDSKTSNVQGQAM
ncbi:hypothetical protein Bbelb_410470, partial [Branchiostoma belcheri]